MQRLYTDLWRNNKNIPESAMVTLSWLPFVGFDLIWVLRPFQEYFTYIEPIPFVGRLKAEKGEEWNPPFICCSPKTQ